MKVEKRLLNDGFEHADMRKVVNLLSSSWNVADLTRMMYASKFINMIGKDTVNVLDIGCSSDRLLQVQQTMTRSPGTKKIKYVGVDMRESSLKKVLSFAKENLSKEAAERVSTETSNITEQSECKYLLKKYGKFDVIALFEVFEHLPNGSQKNVLKYIDKLLDENGVLLLSTPVHYVEEDMYWPNDHEKEFMFEELKQILSEQFEITNVCGNHVDANKLKQMLNGRDKEIYNQLLKVSKNGVWLNEIFGSVYKECCKGCIFVCKKRKVN